MMSALTGFAVEVCQYLAGPKKAILKGQTLYVSPAMFALMQGATSEELEHLFSKIELLKIPEMDFSMPMFLSCPEKAETWRTYR